LAIERALQVQRKRQAPPAHENYFLTACNFLVGYVAESTVRQGKDGKFYPQRASNRKQGETSAASLDRADAALQSEPDFDDCIARLNKVSLAGVPGHRADERGYLGYGRPATTRCHPRPNRRSVRPAGEWHTRMPFDDF
jgi:hypothetical protein